MRFFISWYDKGIISIYIKVNIFFIIVYVILLVDFGFRVILFLGSINFTRNNEIKNFGFWGVNVGVVVIDGWRWY